MDNPKSAVQRAKITYFFKETFRAHSMAEYREIFSRGLNEDNSGITGSYPWLYVRAFFALFILFTVNTLILRLTNNTLYVPTVAFLGGITFTIPFIVLLYELYPKRDVSIFVLIAFLVGGGTVSGALCQLCYLFIPVNNAWVSALCAGIIEEICKALTAIIAIIILRQKNPYACFLIAAAVGAGFSIVEDIGYIFSYSDRYVFNYNSDISATITVFVDRGLSSFCTHILWTGAVGWAYSISKRPFRSVVTVTLAVSIILHIGWDLPLEGWYKALVTVLCVIIAAAINITVVHKSRINTLAFEVDLTHLNEVIIAEAKTMGEKLRFRNAANLTFALTCTLLSVIILLLCALPIGLSHQSVTFADKNEFIAYLEGGYTLTAETDRKYDPEGHNVVEMYSEEGGEMVLNYIVQTDRVEGAEGVYYYGYYLNDKDNVYSISVELEDYPSLIPCAEYKFGTDTEWVFEVNTQALHEYSYNSRDGSISAVIDADEFEGYDLLIALCATAAAISFGCMVILVAFRIKLGRVKDEQ